MKAARACEENKLLGVLLSKKKKKNKSVFSHPKCVCLEGGLWTKI